MKVQGREFDGRWYVDIQDLLLLIENVKREVPNDHHKLEVLRIVLEDIRKQME